MDGKRSRRNSSKPSRFVVDSSNNKKRLKLDKSIDVTEEKPNVLNIPKTNASIEFIKDVEEKERNLDRLTQSESKKQEDEQPKKSSGPGRPKLSFEEKMLRKLERMKNKHINSNDKVSKSNSDQASVVSNENKGRGRPKLTEEEKIKRAEERALLMKQGILNYNDPNRSGPGRPRLTEEEKAQRAKERLETPNDDPEKKGPGRPRKELSDDEYETYSYNIKRGPGRPLKSGQIQTVVGKLNHPSSMPKIEAISKRGRPRKADEPEIIFIDRTRDGLDLVLNANPKRGRGRPRKSTNLPAFSDESDLSEEELEKSNNVFDATDNYLNELKDDEVEAAILSATYSNKNRKFETSLIASTDHNYLASKSGKPSLDYAKTYSIKSSVPDNKESDDDNEEDDKESLKQEQSEIDITQKNMENNTLAEFEFINARKEVVESELSKLDANKLSTIKTIKNLNDTGNLVDEFDDFSSELDIPIIATEANGIDGQSMFNFKKAKRTKWATIVKNSTNVEKEHNQDKDNNISSQIVIKNKKNIDDFNIDETFIKSQQNRNRNKEIMKSLIHGDSEEEEEEEEDDDDEASNHFDSEEEEIEAARHIDENNDYADDDDDDNEDEDERERNINGEARGYDYFAGLRKNALNRVSQATTNETDKKKRGRKLTVNGINKGSLFSVNLPPIEQKELLDILRKHENSQNDEVNESIVQLIDLHKSQFKQWYTELHLGFNLIFYGLGSKRKLLNEFATTYLATGNHSGVLNKDNIHFPVLIVNGFFPSITIKDIFGPIIEKVIQHRGVLGTIQEQLGLIYDYFNGERSEGLNIDERRDRRLYIVIHNIDGENLRQNRIQEGLAMLASIPKVHLIASVDVLNSAILWDNVHISRLRAIWHDATTFSDYLAETTFENTMLSQGGSGGELGIRGMVHVLRSLNSNSRSLFKILAEWQIQQEENGGDENINNDYADNRYNYNEDDTNIDEIEDEIDKELGPYKTKKQNPKKKTNRKPRINRNNNKKIGLTSSEYYQQAREQFIVSNETTFRTQLVEFIDHGMIVSKRGDHGEETLRIPVPNSSSLFLLISNC